MGLSLNMGFHQWILCVICDEPMPHDENSKCIAARLEREAKRKIAHRCPKCRKRTVGVNRADYYECRACHTQYTASPIAGGEDPDTLESTFIFTGDGENAIQVLVMKTPGSGEFPHDATIKDLVDRVAEARKEARKKARS